MASDNKYTKGETGLPDTFEHVWEAYWKHYIYTAPECLPSHKVVGEMMYCAGRSSRNAELAEAKAEIERLGSLPSSLVEMFAQYARENTEAAHGECNSACFPESYFRGKADGFLSAITRVEAISKEPNPLLAQVEEQKAENERLTLELAWLTRPRNLSEWMEEIRMWKEECHKESDRVADLKQRVAELEGRLPVLQDLVTELKKQRENALVRLEAYCPHTRALRHPEPA
jgi:DNA repair exonuclease SbcCD ATPase subunit